MLKTWNLKKYDNDELEKIMKTYEVSELKAKMLMFRNIEFEDIGEFLHGTLDDLRDPYGIKDMDKLVERIDKAIKNNELICIYGDYDVDGVTSITVMYKFLTAHGARVMYYLPDRLVEGYGVNKGALDNIKSQGASLVITVDCGITAVEEVEYAKEIGFLGVINNEASIDNNQQIGDSIDIAFLVLGKKLGVNTKEMPEKTPVSFVLLDNHHLCAHGVEYFCARSKQFVLITTNRNHPAFDVKQENLHIICQEKLSLSDALTVLKEQYGCERLTIQSGGTVNALFLREKLFDFVDIVVAPVLIGGKDTATLIDGDSLQTQNELAQLGVLHLIEAETLQNSYVRLRYQVMR